MSDETQDQFSIVYRYLERCETRLLSRQICAEIDHDTTNCRCFTPPEIDEMEAAIPAKLDYFLIQPDGKMMNELKRDNLPLPTVFVSETMVGKTRQTSKSTNSRKRKESVLKDNEEARKRREIKKKLFNDLGIHRSDCGIDDKAKKREDSMKRKVTETIVTTYCALCEQNFSSPKMLLLHNTKVHETSTLECPCCMKLFDQTILFNRHMKTHYGPNAQYLVQCEFCDRKFKDKDSLTTHINVTH